MLVDDLGTVLVNPSAWRVSVVSGWTCDFRWEEHVHDGSETWRASGYVHVRHNDDLDEVHTSLMVFEEAVRVCDASPINWIVGSTVFSWAVDNNGEKHCVIQLAITREPVRVSLGGTPATVRLARHGDSLWSAKRAYRLARHFGFDRRDAWGIARDIINSGAVPDVPIRRVAPQYVDAAISRWNRIQSRRASIQLEGLETCRFRPSVSSRVDDQGNEIQTIEL